MRIIRIGGGAGYGGDRIEPALDLISRGELDYIIFECLAERTIALAQQQKLKDSTKGYNELLEYRMERILPLLKMQKEQGKKVPRIVTNMGAANPAGAAAVMEALACKAGLPELKIAAVLGDDVTAHMADYLFLPILETGEPLSSLGDKVVSANAYIGAEGIVRALRAGADIVVTGRVADPALVLGPLVYSFGWSMEDYHMLGKGTAAGHLLECGAQVCGGYFADPGCKDVPELWNVGFPIAEVREDGQITITKLPDAGGMVTEATVSEQLIYEIHDPAAYLTPDVTADFSKIWLEQESTDRVVVNGVSGKARNGLYKVSVGYRDGFIGEGEISYGGSGCVARARLAEEILRRRLERYKDKILELRTDLIGVNSLYGGQGPEPCECRLRVALRSAFRDVAAQAGNEAEALYTNGPAGGGGARKYLREVLSVASVLIPREDVAIRVTIHGEEVQE